MIRSAILTDIHANRDALNAALDAIARAGVDQLIFLGDYIGGGPDIAPVLERVEAEVARGAIALRGNHDRTMPTPSGTLNPSARRIVDWTVVQLTARHRLFLDDLPLQAQWGGVQFSHASPHAPQDWYPVTDCGSAALGFTGNAPWLMMCGHARQPALYSLTSAGEVRAQDVPFDQPITLDAGAQWLAVVGPVGGSVAATGGNAAQYCLLERSEKDKRAVISYHRAPYDGAAVLRRARGAHMPSVLMR
jgi:hypothetical protein